MSLQGAEHRAVPKFVAIGDIFLAERRAEDALRRQAVEPMENTGRMLQVSRCRTATTAEGVAAVH